MKWWRTRRACPRGAPSWGRSAPSRRAAKSVPAASRDVIAFRDGVPFEVGGELGAVLAQLKNAAALG